MNANKPVRLAWLRRCLSRLRSYAGRATLIVTLACSFSYVSLYWAGWQAWLMAAMMINAIGQIFDDQLRDWDQWDADEWDRLPLEVVVNVTASPVRLAWLRRCLSRLRSHAGRATLIVSLACSFSYVILYWAGWQAWLMAALMINAIGQIFEDQLRDWDQWDADERRVP